LCSTIKSTGKLPLIKGRQKTPLSGVTPPSIPRVPRNLTTRSGAGGICSNFRRRPTPATTSGAATNAPYGRSPRPVSSLGESSKPPVTERERDLALLRSSVRRGGRVSREVVARAAVRHVARMAAGDPQPHAPHCVPTPYGPNALLLLTDQQVSLSVCAVRLLAHSVPWRPDVNVVTSRQAGNERPA
jgi:hypothetical protein